MVEISILGDYEDSKLRDLVKIFEEVFEMEPFSYPDEDYFKALLRDPHFLAIAADVNNQPVAAMTVYLLPQVYTKKPLAYPYVMFHASRRLTNK